MKVLLDFVNRIEEPITTIEFEHDAPEHFIQLRDRTGSTIAVLDPQTDYVKVILPTKSESEVPNPPDPVVLSLVSVTPSSFPAADNVDHPVTVVGTGIDETCVLWVNGYTSTGNVVVDDTSFTCMLNPLLISGVTGDPGTHQAIIKKGAENSPESVTITLT